MTIYRMTANVKRNRFMERPLYFTQEMLVIADSYDQAVRYVHDRLDNANDEVKVMGDSEDVLALFDVRNGEEKIIV